MSDEITKQEIADHYTRMGHSVTLINAVIEGTKYSNETSEEKQKCVDRNVAHLEIMLDKDYWTNEDMTAVDKAIKDGKAYKA